MPAEKRACGAPGAVHATQAARLRERRVEMPKSQPVRVYAPAPIVWGYTPNRIGAYLLW